MSDPAAPPPPPPPAAATSDTIRVLCRVRPSKRPSGFFAPTTDGLALHFSVPADVERDVTNHAGAPACVRVFDCRVGTRRVVRAVGAQVVPVAARGKCSLEAVTADSEGDARFKKYRPRNSV